MTVCHGNYIEDQRNQTYLQMLFIVRDAYMIQGVIETVNLKKKKTFSIIFTFTTFPQLQLQHKIDCCCKIARLINRLPRKLWPCTFFVLDKKKKH